MVACTERPRARLGGGDPAVAEQQHRARAPGEPVVVGALEAGARVARPPAACPPAPRRSARCRAGGRRRRAPRRGAARRGSCASRARRGAGRAAAGTGRQRTPTRSPTRVTGSAMRPRSVPNSFVCTATAIRTCPPFSSPIWETLTLRTVASASAVAVVLGEARGRSTSSARRRRARGTWPPACAAPTRARSAPRCRAARRAAASGRAARRRPRRPPPAAARGSRTAAAAGGGAGGGPARPSARCRPRAARAREHLALTAAAAGNDYDSADARKPKNSALQRSAASIGGKWPEPSNISISHAAAGARGSARARRGSGRPSAAAGTRPRPASPAPRRASRACPSPTASRRRPRCRRVPWVHRIGGLGSRSTIAAQLQYLRRRAR